MNKLSVFLSHRVKYVTKLHLVQGDVSHAKMKGFWGRNGLTTLVNTVSPLIFQNSAIAPFTRSIYCFYVKVYAAVLKHVVN